MGHQIEQHESGTMGAFFVQQKGQRVAEMTYRRESASTITVEHTEVDPSLSGQGVGRELLGALVDWARATSTKVVPRCPYVKAQFDKDSSIRDVLA